MNILMVHHQMHLYGGAELVVVRLADYLIKQGHHVDILTASAAMRPEYEGLRFILPKRQVNWKLWDGVGSLVSIAAVYDTLRALYKEYAPKYDIVNPHNFPAPWVVRPNDRALWMCNELPDLWHSSSKTSLFYKLFGIGRWLDSRVVRSRRMSAIVADAVCYDRFVARYGFAPHIVPYGIDGEYFSQALGNPRSNCFRVIQPSMISPSKQQMVTLEAIQDLDAEVVFAGYYEPHGVYAKALVDYAHKHRIHITFTGHVLRASLLAYYKTSHVAVFPGRGQGSWLGPFEAIAAGVPIIVSPNLSCSSLIEEHDLGIVTNDFTAALRHVYQHYELCRNNTLRAQKFVLQELTWDKFGQRMLEVMKYAV